ncbi:putative mRNA splicing protein [Nadsonia fulvescens var. elongata DSM 6958]|uniref:Putative mRNA splicing protein n=1 Tax=Nadsonia fulvescens var. elongata DSM 6958 TaxID=857566 RepID=A0A1E3PEZ9_9ASCO|nr:putative mRNA splicing protein [Nadsonia fulvescens var. elongata DSM 6958]
MSVSQFESETIAVGLFEQSPEWVSAKTALNKDKENFELWESFILITESLSGPLGLESTDMVKHTTRQTYDEFLARFPLLFGYWKKYAEIERLFSGDEDYENILSRAVESFPNSIDLWVDYLSHIMVHRFNDFENLRTLFEKSIKFCGRDFLSHPIWDKYIEFESKLRPDSIEILRILKQVITYPLHQYARYLQEFVRVSSLHHITESVSSEKLSEIKATVRSAGQDENDEALLKYHIDSYNVLVYEKTKQDVMDRWQYESQITRSYFHVAPLEDSQLELWKNYIKYEESKGDFNQTRFLYERALVPCAIYDSIWLRYIRWLSQYPDMDDEIRALYIKATTCFVPSVKTFVRYQYALFEEKLKNYDAARKILLDMQLKNSGQGEPFIYRIQFERRIGTPELSISYCTKLLNLGNSTKKITTSSDDQVVSKDEATSPITIDTSDSIEELEEFKKGLVLNESIKGTIAAEVAKIQWKNMYNIPGARKTFRSFSDTLVNSLYFWSSYFQFELEQCKTYSAAGSNSKRFKYISKLVDIMRSRARIPPYAINDLIRSYMDTLLACGTKQMMNDYMKLDSEVNGPFSVNHAIKRKIAPDSKPETTNRRLKLENGHPGVEVSDKHPNENYFAKYLQQQDGILAP